MVFDAGASDRLRSIIGADPDFDVARFMEGAQAAYGMVLEAYWKGDREELASRRPRGSRRLRDRDRRARGRRPCPRQPPGQYRARYDRGRPARRQGGRDRGPLPSPLSPRSRATRTAMSSPARSATRSRPTILDLPPRPQEPRPELAAGRDRRSRLSSTFLRRLPCVMAAPCAPLPSLLQRFPGRPLPDFFAHWKSQLPQLPAARGAERARPCELRPRRSGASAGARAASGSGASAVAPARRPARFRRMRWRQACGWAADRQSTFRRALRRVFEVFRLAAPRSSSRADVSGLTRPEDWRGSATGARDPSAARHLLRQRVRRRRDRRRRRLRHRLLRTGDRAAAAPAGPAARRRSTASRPICWSATR